MKKIIISVAAAGALAVALPAAAQAKVNVFPCGNGGSTPAGVTHLRAAKVSCVDARKVVRAVEAHRNFCRPATGGVAPFRICDVQVAGLAAGTLTFHCVGQFLNTGTAKYTERCSAPGTRRVLYERNYNSPGR
jgi:hypothetical protein